MIHWQDKRRIRPSLDHSQISARFVDHADCDIRSTPAELPRKEAFRNSFRYLQGVELPLSSFREDASDCPAQRSGPFSPKGDCPEIAGQIKEVPLRFFDFSTKSVTIEILDGPPAGQEIFGLHR